MQFLTWEEKEREAASGQKHQLRSLSPSWHPTSAAGSAFPILSCQRWPSSQEINGLFCNSHLTPENGRQILLQLVGVPLSYLLLTFWVWPISVGFPVGHLSVFVGSLKLIMISMLHVICVLQHDTSYLMYPQSHRHTRAYTVVHTYLYICMLYVCIYPQTHILVLPITVPLLRGVQQICRFANKSVSVAESENARCRKKLEDVQMREGGKRNATDNPTGQRKPSCFIHSCLSRAS